MRQGKVEGNQMLASWCRCSLLGRVGLVDFVVPSFNWDSVPDDKVICILSGDGRQMGKKHGVMISLKILFPHHSVDSTKCTFPIAIGRGTEQYENLALMFSGLSASLLALRTRSWKTPKDKEVTVKLFFTSDVTLPWNEGSKL